MGGGGTSCIKRYSQACGSEGRGKLQQSFKENLSLLKGIMSRDEYVFEGPKNQNDTV
jgi:hypothetical protein